MTGSEIKFKLALGKDFLTSFSDLPNTQQGKVRKFITDFRQNPASRSIHFEKIQGAKDPNLHSVRIDQDYRGIILKPDKGNVYVFLWVDHHDKAYAWAMNKLISIHPETGAIQMIEVDKDTQVEEHLNKNYDRGSTNVEQSAPAIEEKTLFSGFRDRELKRIGVPGILIPFIRQLSTESDLENCTDKLPQEVYEALFLLAAGSSIHEVELELFASKEQDIDTDDFSEALEKDDSKRRFVVITEDTSLQEVLDYPLEHWRVFLHPSQRELVRKKTSGPSRVLGGAGTGKTVVAMHRAKHLVSKVFTAPTDMILFTTFTKNLALDIEENMKKICPLGHLKRIEIKNLDAWAYDFLNKNGYTFHLLRDKKRKECWQEALQMQPDYTQFAEHFFKLEWEHIIQENGIETREEYLTIPRTGSGRSLSRKGRNIIWPVFKRYRELLDMYNLVEYQDIIRKAWQLIEKKKTALPYKAIIVDEAQDFSANAYRLIKAIASSGERFGPDSLFITGDSHQRIYGRKVILKHCGIPIIGRSKILRVNYRTTEQTRKYAVSILANCTFDDLDGEPVWQKGYVSLLKGGDPLVQGADTFKKEIENIRDYLTSLISSETDVSGICIVARTNKLVSEYEGALKADGFTLTHIETEEKTDKGGIRIATMHRVKGLDFDHMILAGINSEDLPLKTLLKNAETPIEKEEIMIKERSLLYVAITRARKSVYISWTGERSPLLPGNFKF